MLPAKFGSIWPGSFREDFFNISQSETRIALGGHICSWPNGAKLGRKHLCKILYKTSSFGSIRSTNMATVTKNRTYGKIARFW
jgi:hypothetical protein